MFVRGRASQGTITAHDSDQWILLLGGDTEDAADLLHDGRTADGAEESFEGLTLTAGASEGAHPGKPQPPQLAWGRTSATSAMRGSSLTSNLRDTT